MSSPPNLKDQKMFNLYSTIKTALTVAFLAASLMASTAPSQAFVSSDGEWQCGELDENGWMDCEWGDF